MVNERGLPCKSDLCYEESEFCLRRLLLKSKGISENGSQTQRFTHSFFLPCMVINMQQLTQSHSRGCWRSPVSVTGSQLALIAVFLSYTRCRSLPFGRAESPFQERESPQPLSTSPCLSWGFFLLLSWKDRTLRSLAQYKVIQVILLPLVCSTELFIPASQAGVWQISIQL